MSEHEIQRLCSLIYRGGKVYVACDADGVKRLNIVRGPFGAVEKFNFTPEIFRSLKEHLASASSFLRLAQ